jgi:hypothetical protein
MLSLLQSVLVVVERLGSRQAIEPLLQSVLIVDSRLGSRFFVVERLGRHAIESMLQSVFIVN